MHRPTLAFILLACLPACAAESDRPFGSGGGGGGGGGGTPTSDAMASGSDAQPGPLQISGRLCLSLDLRDPLACAATTALAGIVIEHKDSNTSTITASDGSFTMNAPTGGSALLTIGEGDDGYRDMLAQVALIEGQALGLRLPAIGDATWQSLLTDVGVLETDGTAAIATYLESNDQPTVNAEVIPPSGSLNAPLYDGPLSPTDWASGGLTGSKGAAIMLGVPTDADTVDFIVSAGAGLQDVSAVPVAAGFLSFVTVVVN